MLVNKKKKKNIHKINFEINRSLTIIDLLFNLLFNDNCKMNVGMLWIHSAEVSQLHDRSYAIQLCRICFLVTAALKLLYYVVLIEYRGN